MKFLNQEGQALLVVVLAMVVVLTVGLAVVSRSVTNLRNSQQEIDSQKALSAAEAGVEQTIKSGTSITEPINISAQTTYQTSTETISGGSDFLLNGNNEVSQDDATYIWLIPYSPPPAQLFTTSWSGNLNIYWGNSTTACNNAALEIAIISGTLATPTVTRYVYDPCSGRRSSNNFSVPSSPPLHPISGITLYNSTGTITVTNGFLARVTPLYANAYIGVSGNPALPSQGTLITSTGTTDTNVVRKLEVFQGYPEVPAELFPFSLFWP
ncbi:MAG: hypothetical protein ABSE17_02620 [Candidatus Levyibacteriota bacterium]|jgi:hypothetical protein